VSPDVPAVDESMGELVNTFDTLLVEALRALSRSVIIPRSCLVVGYRERAG
jgi:hypothetical protein